jgi:hypothetical protein
VLPSRERKVALRNLTERILDRWIAAVALRNKNQFCWPTKSTRRSIYSKLLPLCGLADAALDFFTRTFLL